MMKLVDKFGMHLVDNVCDGQESGLFRSEHLVLCWTLPLPHEVTARGQVMVSC